MCSNTCLENHHSSDLLLDLVSVYLSKTKMRLILICRCMDFYELLLYFMSAHHTAGGPDSVVSIATGYGLDGPGIESWWGRNFPHLSSPALGPTQPPVQ